jgi:type II secretory pathway pseudopilin PulG
MRREINADVIGKHILHWALDFDAFNKNVLGPTSKIALNAIRDGKPVSELENNGVTGAAMRASPLGCLLPATRLEHFVEQVALASSPTHKSDLAIAGAVVIAWAVSRAIDGERWQNIVDALPGIARYAQEAKTTTFSASLAARIELALKTVREANGTNPPASRFISSSGGTSTIEFRRPLRWLNWQEPTRTAAPFYAPTWAVIRTPLARWRRPSAARCTACRRLIRRSKMNSTPSTSSTLVTIAKNCCTTGSKGRAYESFAQRLKHCTTRPVTVLGAAGD